MSNTAYPGALDSPTNPSTSDTLATVPHHLQHGLENDAIVALETKLGTGSSSQTPNTGMYLVGSGSGATQWVSTLTSPSITTSLLDVNNKTWIGVNPVGSGAVNYPYLGNSTTTNAVTYGVAGSDSNIGVNLVPKGSGKVQDNGTNLIDFRSSFSNFIVGGTGIWTQNAGLVGSMTAAMIWIAGVEYSVAAVSSHTFGASVDTYIDYTVGTGITYTAVSNNAASPSLAANSVRIAIVVTNGSAITSLNQGSTIVTAPVASSVIYSVTDSLGNLIYPANPNPTVVGYRQITSNFTTTSTSVVQVPGLTAQVNIPVAGRRYKITAYTPSLYSSSTTVGGVMSIWSGTVGSGTQLNATQGFGNSSGGDAVTSGIVSAIINPSVGLQTYNVGAFSAAAATTTLVGGATTPAYVLVEAA